MQTAFRGNHSTENPLTGGDGLDSVGLATSMENPRNSCQEQMKLRSHSANCQMSQAGKAGRKRVSIADCSDAVVAVRLLPMRPNCTSIVCTGAHYNAHGGIEDGTGFAWSS
eukprot:837231-Amphidinium_carterae.2